MKLRKRKAFAGLLGAWVLLMIPASFGQQASITVDLSRTGEPISKYLYGQFVEHLGRCIYGGLWAEMLEDRKFYYPITGEAPAWEMFQPGESSWEGEGHPYELLMRSPWLVLGSKDAVRMDRSNPYVGEHSARISLGGDGRLSGIFQERLGLVEGGAYTGRIVLSGSASAGPIEISLVWGSGAHDRYTVLVPELGEAFQTFALEFASSGSTDNGRIEIGGRGTGWFSIGAVSLMPSDQVYGWRRDTLEQVRRLNSPVYRWPGGNFVSGYDWKDGIGDPDRRPPRKNPAWKGIESNDVGIHEFLEFCRQVGAEAYIAVNTGLGDARGAAEEVEYVNGGVETPMGRLRARNGHPAPFGVKWWAIGNEMYGDWQLGHMPLQNYLLKHVEIVDAMRVVDPSIRPISVGSLGEWSRKMLESCSDHMAMISEHLYWQDKEDLGDHVRQVPEGIRRVAAQHRAYRREIESLRGKDVRIALDEWNYWYGANEYGELGVRYFLQDALGIAAGLHELFRNSDLFFMANYAQAVNVIGAIKTTRTRAEMESTGLVLELYRRHFGEVPVFVSGSFDPLDISAAWADGRNVLTLAVVNPTESDWQLEIALEGSVLSDVARCWVLSGKDRWAYNQPGRSRGVDVRSSTYRGEVRNLELEPLSVTLFEFPLGSEAGQ